MKASGKCAGEKYGRAIIQRIFRYKLRVNNATDPPLKWLGFRLDEDGRITCVEEGLSELERLALLAHVREFAKREVAEISGRLGRMELAPHTSG